MTVKLTVVLTLSICFAKAQVANRYDVVIDEIMADPSPQVALPNVEFIELKNVSATAFNLNGWKVGDATGSGTINSNFILQPDSFVIVCSTGSAAALSTYGSVIGMSNFPSLDNNGDVLFIRSKEGKTIHAVAYDVSWYKNDVKNQGGWTLEMIDTRNPCSGSDNWNTSTDTKGGTPGKKNAVDAINKDDHPPALLRAFATDSVTLSLMFDEPLDSAQAANVAHYNIEGAGNPQSVSVLSPLFNTVQLKTATALVKNKAYNISVNNVADCSNNATDRSNTVKAALAVTATTFDIVINEILFNPTPGGVDYVEVYNRSSNIIDLKDCYIANRSSNGNIASLQQVSTINRLLFPGDYMVLTENPATVQQQYITQQPDAFTTISSMPSYPDDKGDVVLLNAQGTILDEVQYDEHWHFKLINNDEGVSLERIDYNKSSQDASNWHSAATNVGYGTPGYRNSQFHSVTALPGDITVSPAVFSPDTDGYDDFTTINYQFPQQGYVCNISIFDASGRVVRYLTKNAVCGVTGYFGWDGIDERGNKLPVGIYVIYAEAFNLQGKIKRYKLAVSLVRKL